MGCQISVVVMRWCFRYMVMWWCDRSASAVVMWWYACDSAVVMSLCLSVCLWHSASLMSLWQCCGVLVISAAKASQVCEGWVGCTCMSGDCDVTFPADSRPAIRGHGFRWWYIWQTGRANWVHFDGLRRVIYCITCYEGLHISISVRLYTCLSYACHMQDNSIKCTLCVHTYM